MVGDSTYFFTLKTGFLHFLAYIGNAKMVEEHLKKHRGLFSTDGTGLTPIEIALKRKNYHIAGRLVDACLKNHSPNEIPNFKQILKLLLTEGKRWRIGELLDSRIVTPLYGIQ